MKELRDEISRLRSLSSCVNVMKISEFSRKLSEAKAAGYKNCRVHKIVSESFYSSPCGYKMVLDVYLNGATEHSKNYISVYLRLLPGDYDVLLPWPLRNVFTFTLIDQQDSLRDRQNISLSVIPNDHRALMKPSNEGNGGYGFKKFVSREILRTRKYIKDDTIFITVSCS